MKRITKITVLLLLTFVTSTPMVIDAKEKAGNEIVNIPDDNLKVCINNTVGSKPGDSISEGELLGITSLFCANEGIKSIEGLEKATNLDYLTLSQNKISDIHPLKGLTLRSLNLSDNNITDLGVLSGLTNLEILELNNNDISDLSPLKGLKKLKQLGLYRTEIRDLSPLSELTNLQNLNLESPKISNIGPLKSLTNLENLELISPKISDISPLSGLTNLENLDLSNDNISNVNSLKGLTKLKYLALYSNKIKDLSPLSRLTNLEYLDLADNNISDVSSLSKLKNLEFLHLHYNKITNINSLSGLTNLQDLALSNNKIKDLSSLSGLTNLQTLYLRYNQISDVKPLSGLINLEKLYLDGNQISDASPLSGLSKLINFSIPDQKFDVNLGVFTNLADIPKEYKVKIKEQDGTEDEIIIPLDDVKNGVNDYSKKYKFHGDTYSGEENIKFQYENVTVIEGIDNIEIEVGEKFDPMQGVKATDNEDGDITSNVKCFTKDGKDDNLSVGKHIYKYSVVDSDGNKTIATREVTVINKLTKTGSNLHFLSVVAIVSLYLMKNLYKANKI